MAAYRAHLREIILHRRASEEHTTGRLDRVEMRVGLALSALELVSLVAHQEGEVRSAQLLEHPRVARRRLVGRDENHLAARVRL